MGVRGEDLPHTKLTEANVLAIRRDHRPGRVSTTVLAHRYGITRQSAWNVLQRHSWAWLEDGAA